MMTMKKKEEATDNTTTTTTTAAAIAAAAATTTTTTTTAEIDNSSMMIKTKERIRIENVTEGCPLTALAIFITEYLQLHHPAPEVEVRKMPLRYAII
jgi:hypothetical protein